MAKIDIFPLNINGINSPLNLIDQILAPQNTVDHLLYPIDLASNPTYCHAIQFTIHEYNYPNITAAFQSAIDITSKATQKVKEAAENAQIPTLPDVNQIPQETKLLYNAAKSGVGNIWKGINPQDIVAFAEKQSENFKYGNFRGKADENILSTISLYMPDSLTTSYDSDYTAIELTSALGAFGYLANALSDSKVKGGIAEAMGGRGISNLMGSEIGKGIMAQIAGGITGGTAIYQQALKQVPNPQLQLLYKGISLRQFQFDFIFTPTSSQEADAVDQIIKTFIHYSLPQTVGPEKMYLKPPQVFKIKFAYTGDQGALSQVTNVLTNTITQALGTQLSGLFGPSAQNKNNIITNATKNAKIFQIKDCVLKNVQLDYAPNGWAAYQDGFPIQTRMSLTFEEMSIQTKDDVKPRGLSSSKTSNDGSVSTEWTDSAKNSLSNAFDYPYQKNIFK
jgi:hypothetical protein